MIELIPHTKWGTEVKLTLTPDEKSVLARKLKALEFGEEHRIESNDITIYFKQREADSRVLISHPEEKIWVVTVALESRYFGLFIDKISKLESFKIDSFCSLNRVSNASLTIL